MVYTAKSHGFFIRIKVTELVSLCFPNNVFCVVRMTGIIQYTVYCTGGDIFKIEKSIVWPITMFGPIFPMRNMGTLCAKHLEEKKIVHFCLNIP
jgi:hypothetical protein